MENKPNEDEKEFLDTLEDNLHDALDASDEKQIEYIVDSISHQEALRQASRLNADDRDQMMSIISPESAADMLEEAEFMRSTSHQPPSDPHPSVPSMDYTAESAEGLL